MGPGAWLRLEGLTDALRTGEAQTVVSRKTCYPGASFNSFDIYRLLAAGVKSANGEPEVGGGVLGSKAGVYKEGAP